MDGTISDCHILCQAVSLTVWHRHSDSRKTVYNAYVLRFHNLGLTRLTIVRGSPDQEH